MMVSGSLAFYYVSSKLEKACLAIRELFHWVNLFEALFEKKHDCEITRLESGKFRVTFETSGELPAWVRAKETKDLDAN
jgi:hypothetical protein